MAVPPLRTQNVIRTIVRDIVESCKSAGTTVSDELAALVVKTVLIHPSNDFDPTVPQTKDDVDRIIQLSTQKLTDPSISLDTLKMQLFFDLNYASRAMFIEEHEKLLNSRVHSQLENLINRRPRTREDLQAMYVDLVNLLIVWSDLGTPNEIITVKETTAALRSVFPQPELGSFLGLDKKDKERQLKELTDIVSGIRLFNKDCGKGGRTIDNIPEKLPGAIAAVMASLEERLYTLTQHTATCLAIFEQLDEVLEEGEKENVWAACANGRQEMVFLNTIRRDLQCIQEEVLKLHKKLQVQLAELHGTVQARVAIPTVQVYPLFIELCQVWKGLRQQMVITSLLHSIMLGFDCYTEQRKKLMKSDLVDKCKDHIVVKTDTARAKDAEQKMDLAPGVYLKVEVRQPEHIQNFDQVALVYQGFCCWALVRRRLLIPGCRKKGVVLYKGRYYTFSSMEAMLQFAINPDWYHESVIKIAKQFPELIHLLQLHTQVYPPTDKTKDIDNRICPSDFVETCNAGVQTETHPIKENLVPTYEWNEWDMRRRAILLANLHSRLTHSTQTKESHLRRENATQVFLPKTTSTQTLKETGVNCVNDHHYLSGLQGYRKGKPSQFKYIDFTQLDL